MLNYFSHNLYELINYDDIILEVMLIYYYDILIFIICGNILFREV